MILRFSQWMEYVSGPEHKADEKNLDLDDSVKRRIEKIISELVGTGKGSREKIMSSLVNYLKANGALPTEEKPKQEPPQEPSQEMPQDNMGQNPMAQGAPNQNPMAMNFR